MSNKNKMALIYDFDLTLTPDLMQHAGCFDRLDIEDSNAFWSDKEKLAEKYDMDGILSYMYKMLESAKQKGKSITYADLKEDGKNIRFYAGVENWFERINQYGADNDVEVLHFIISSGLKEIIEGTSIAKYFTHVYASSYFYDANGHAVWPSTSVNYTSKTQHLFRINKGVYNSYENKRVNEFVPEDEKPIPFKNMVYIGDGDTDVPAMKMTSLEGGSSIIVYEDVVKNGRDYKQVAGEYLKRKRVDYACVADYSDGSQLDTLVKGLIDKLSADLVARKFKVVG